MADTAIMEGGTIAVGDTATPNTLTFLSTQFLPAQVATGIAHGFNGTVYASEALGLALASTAGFNTNFAGLSTSAFVTAVANATGVNATAIQGFLNNWTVFYTANPNARPGLSVTQAAYGATFGDSIGVALLNPTAANLQTVVSTTPNVNAFTPNTIAGLVANALIDNAEGTYKTGVSLAALPPHTPLQGEAGSGANGVFLTTGIDSPTQGFSNSPTGTPLLNGFTATNKGQIFNAQPAVSALGIGNNTLTTGDNLQDTALDGTLNFTTAQAGLGIIPTNPALVTAVTMNGVSTANITNVSSILGFPFVAGFSGNITGLTTVNDNNSTGTVQLGALGQGLNTLLTTVNINGYSTLSSGIVGGTAIFAGIVAAAAGDATKTINVAITGSVGSFKQGADTLIFSNDVGGGTAANPNLSYGTWHITSNNNSALILQQEFNGFVANAAFAPVPGGVGAATALTLDGKGSVAVSQDAPGNWQKLTAIDGTAQVGSVIVTGANSTVTGPFYGIFGNALSSANNPFWSFGQFADLTTGAGLLQGNTVLANFKGSTTGLNVLDVSSLNAAQMAKLTATGNTAAGIENQIVVQNAVATTLAAATFGTITNFQQLDVGASATTTGIGGTIDLKLLPATINDIFYMTASSGAVTINNQTIALTVDTEDNGGGNGLTVGKVGPAPGLADNFTLIVGNPLHNDPTFTSPGAGAGSVGTTTVFGDEVVSIVAQGQVAGGAKIVDLIGLTNLSPSLAGNEQVTISGTTILHMTSLFDVSSAGGILGGNNINNMLLTITDTAPTDFLAPGQVFNVNGNSSFVPYSTNAVKIDAGASGGLFMLFGDANFTFSPTAGGSIGDTITGSATKGNLIGGSIGNDTLTGTLSTSNWDTIYTNGGKDVITLAAGHSQPTPGGLVDHVDFYAGNGYAGPLDTGNAGVPVASLPGAITNFADQAQSGWWGLGTGSAQSPFGILGPGNNPNSGTSADMSTVTNIDISTGFGGPAFHQGDIFDFSIGAWGTGINTFGGANLGNVQGNLAHDTPGTVAQFITPGLVPTGANTLGTFTNLVVLQGTFANADQVAKGIDVNHDIFFTAGSTLANKANAHFLVGYEDSTGQVRIADADILNVSGAAAAGWATNGPAETVHVSDIVQLVGVNLSQLVGGGAAPNAASTIHIVA